ncbi:hypothetical protein THTE_0562 [Thermogutta terrifontis]|uniref:Uncharacterized protein n=1 Tax=Thermogutta terrifontis TaxID=1331910 RepID=A0A286RB23_9BACT|nr:hypothetical protein THTE_0562 [Thermogutta terrifontis]
MHSGKWLCSSWIGCDTAGYEDPVNRNTTPCTISPRQAVIVIGTWPGRHGTSEKLKW